MCNEYKTGGEKTKKIAYASLAVTGKLFKSFKGTLYAFLFKYPRSCWGHAMHDNCLRMCNVQFYV